MRLRLDRRAIVSGWIAVLILCVSCTKTPNDNELSRQIQAKLSQDSGLQQKSIAVQTVSGVVTLSGRVDNDAQRMAAARYASSTPGIKQVVNNLVIATAPALTTQATPAPPPAKPSGIRKSAGIPQSQNSGASSGRDPSEWDSPGSSSTNTTNSNEPRTSGASQDAASAAPAAAADVTPPPAPVERELTIESGAPVAVRLVDALDSETAQPGQTFRATLESPLLANGEVAIRSGYNVEGHVVEVKSAGKFAGQSILVLQLDRISAGGNSYSVHTDRYRRTGSNRSTNTAEKVGGGAAIGAILGGILGGGKGAGIGAAAGGGLGGGVQAAGKGQQIKLASESVLTFTLQEPLTVTQVDKGPEAGRPRLDTPH